VSERAKLTKVLRLRLRMTRVLTHKLLPYIPYKLRKDFPKLTNQEFELSIEKVKNGDKSGLKEIYEAYLPYIFRVIYEILKSRENAEDLTSDFFIKLWEKAASFRPGSGHKAFMSVMARNMAIDFLRKYKKEELTCMLQDLGCEPDSEATHINRISASLDDNPTETEVIGEMVLKDALDALGDAERQIITMKVLGDLTFKEIAETLIIPMGTVTWRYQNAIKKLRRCGYE